MTRADEALRAEWAAAAATLVVESGLDYTQARCEAAEQLGIGRARSHQAPDHLAIEDEVRAQLALFQGQTQPAELRALRQRAAVWMERLQAFRPHLGGAVWRGTATRHSPIRLDLYCEDPKSLEISLIDRGVGFDVADGGQDDTPALWLSDQVVGIGRVDVLLTAHDLDALRGALQPDARGGRWRGDLPALRRLMESDG